MDTLYIDKIHALFNEKLSPYFEGKDQKNLDFLRFKLSMLIQGWREETLFLHFGENGKISSFFCGSDAIWHEKNYPGKVIKIYKEVDYSGPSIPKYHFYLCKKFKDLTSEDYSNGFVASEFQKGNKKCLFITK